MGMNYVRYIPWRLQQLLVWPLLPNQMASKCSHPILCHVTMLLTTMLPVLYHMLPVDYITVTSTTMLPILPCCQYYTSTTTCYRYYHVTSTIPHVTSTTMLQYYTTCYQYYHVTSTIPHVTSTTMLQYYTTCYQYYHVTVLYHMLPVLPCYSTIPHVTVLYHMLPVLPCYSTIPHVTSTTMLPVLYHMLPVLPCYSTIPHVTSTTMLQYYTTCYQYYHVTVLYHMLPVLPCYSTIPHVTSTTMLQYYTTCYQCLAYPNPINRSPGLSEDKIVYCISNDRQIVT